MYTEKRLSTDKQNGNYLIVNDYIQSVVDTSTKPFIKEFILIVCLYFFYNIAPTSVFISFLKYVFIMIFFRYFLSVVTQIQNKHGQRHFILNANVIIFVLVLLSLNRHQLFERTFLMWLLITLYSLLVISTKEHYTSDVILTIILVYSLYENTYIRYYIDNITKSDYISQNLSDSL